MALLDPHSFADADQPAIRAMTLELRVDFERRVLAGTARLELERPAEGVLDLDTKDLAIKSVTNGDKEPLRFELGPPDKVLGQRLRIHTHGQHIELRYQCSPEATALQWLAPEQTHGGRHPFVFTQCQAIHARSVMPCQDTPRVRSQFRVRLDVPHALTAVMAAAPLGRTEPQDASERAYFDFEMPQPIPSYLFAFAVGELTSKELGPRSRVFAEPGLVEAAAWEFAEVDRMLTTAEQLFGAYDWDRFDLLLMPPSFPYGGMENPRLTFLTPTLLAGDRSLVNVVAHELAHSWTGNLVTNASLNDFWLNEGFTVYAERRILEALEGTESRALHAALGYRGLLRDVERLNKKDPQLTRLKNKLSGVDPDEVYSLVPYEKGYLFLLHLERLVGRARFDEFLACYIAHFRFQSITTEDFVAFVEASLPDAAQSTELQGWLEGVGIPDSAPVERSERLERVLALARAWHEGQRPAREDLAALDPTEWQVFLHEVPQTLTRQECAWLDDEFRLSAQSNFEVRSAWLTIAAASSFEPSFPVVRQTLLSVGRMKYLRPLYAALLAEGPRGKALARSYFEEAQGRYHPVARGVIEGLLAGR